ncbi:MAG: hypothetical protein ABJB47_16525, partial [Actinomycetota bacterium]
FMRLGNVDDAKVASEQIGTEHRFVISQLTDTIGTSVTDTGGDSYTSTVGTSDSVADSVSVSDTASSSRGTGRSRADPLAPFGSFTASTSRDASTSLSVSGSRSVTAGISDSTAWGVSTSRAFGGNESLARTSQRSREFLVEAHELQQLPPSAVLVSYAGPAGRQIVLADANPGIIGLPTATLAGLDEARRAPETAGPAYGPGEDGSWRGAGAAATVGPAGGNPGDTGDTGATGGARWGGRPGGGPAGPGSGSGPERGPGSGLRRRPGREPDDDEPPPNLGPPPKRLDWRTYRRP